MTRQEEIKILLAHTVQEIVRTAGYIENTMLLVPRMTTHIMKMIVLCTTIDNLRKEHENLGKTS